MTEIVDLKTRRKTKAPVDEPETKPEDFFKELSSEENLKDVRGAIVITWGEDGVSEISHLNASWMEVLWYGHELMSYATEPEYEDDE